MSAKQLAMDVRSVREVSREDSYTQLSEAYDEVRELLEEVGVAVDLEDEDRLAAAVAAAAAWWRAQ